MFASIKILKLLNCKSILNDFPYKIFNRGKLENVVIVFELESIWIIHCNLKIRLIYSKFENNLHNWDN
jgi:hypothetical protein